MLRFFFSFLQRRVRREGLFPLATRGGDALEVFRVALVPMTSGAKPNFCKRFRSRTAAHRLARCWP